jgi:hypothetical protein
MERFVAYYKALPQYLHEGTEKNHKNSQDCQSVAKIQNSEFPDIRRSAVTSVLTCFCQEIR